MRRLKNSTINTIMALYLISDLLLTLIIINAITKGYYVGIYNLISILFIMGINIIVIPFRNILKTWVF